jgi:hypothetical protein
MKTQMSAQILLGVTLFSLFTMLVASCNPDGTTLIQTRTPTATLPPCPPITINTPDIQGFRKTVFVILIQPDPYYEYSTDAMSVIQNVLPEVIEPGDVFYIFRMGIYGDAFEDALISHGIASDLSHPAIPATPTYMPTLTPTNIPNTPQSSVAKVAATAQAEQTMTASNATATQSTFMYNCAVQEWNRQYQQQATDWEATKTVVRRDSSDLTV